MWPALKKETKRIVKATVTENNGRICIDARGQSCPNFIISIQRALKSLQPGIDADLLLTYAPGNADIRILCAARKIKILAMKKDGGEWFIKVRKPVMPDEQKEVDQIYRYFIEGKNTASI